MDISSAKWWFQTDQKMNMNDHGFVNHYQMTMSPFDEPFSTCTSFTLPASDQAEMMEEKPVFYSSEKANYQNTLYSSPPPPSSSSSGVISFSNSNSNSNSPSASTAAQNYLEKLKPTVKTEVVPSGTTINFSNSTGCLNFDFEDRQHLIQAYGFGADDTSDKKSFTRTAMQAQDHVLAERKRRERLTQRFVALSTLIPNLKKLDKATVLGDAIEYIKQLEDHVKTLEKGSKKYKEEEVVPAAKKARLLSSYGDSSSSDESSSTNTDRSVPEIEVKASDENVLIRIFCKKKTGTIKDIFSQVEKLHLTIVSSSVMPFGYSTTHIAIIAQMDEKLSTTEKHVENRIRVAIMKIIGS